MNLRTMLRTLTKLTFCAVSENLKSVLYRIAYWHNCVCPSHFLGTAQNLTKDRQVYNIFISQQVTGRHNWGLPPLCQPTSLLLLINKFWSKLIWKLASDDGLPSYQANRATRQPAPDNGLPSYQAARVNLQSAPDDGLLSYQAVCDSKASRPPSLPFFSRLISEGSAKVCFTICCNFFVLLTVDRW